MRKDQSTALSAALEIDANAEADRIAAAIREQVGSQLRRRGVVLGLSGGIDSSVSAALAVRALGPNRVLGLFMPEHDSSPDSLRLGRLLAQSLGIRTHLEDIGDTLAAAGCYRRRDEAIRSVVPEYNERYQMKIALPTPGEEGGFAIHSLVVRSPQGVERRVRLTADAYRTIVASTNFKQRVRKMMEYFHADRNHYAVLGTPNRLEDELGFFVKNGDGSADIKPIAHLYKSQVYALARALDVPEEIQQRPPTTDTYSLAQSQEEFYFAMPLEQMDWCMYGCSRGIPAEEIAAASGIPAARVAQAYREIEQTRRTTTYLRTPPLTLEAAARSAPASLEAEFA
jgi:NAD+ synthase